MMINEKSYMEDGRSEEDMDEVATADYDFVNDNFNFKDLQNKKSNKTLGHSRDVTTDFTDTNMNIKSAINFKN